MLWINMWHRIWFKFNLVWLWSMTKVKKDTRKSNKCTACISSKHFQMKGNVISSKPKTNMSLLRGTETYTWLIYGGDVGVSSKVSFTNKHNGYYCASGNLSLCWMGKQNIWQVTHGTIKKTHNGGVKQAISTNYMQRCGSKSMLLWTVGRQR